MTTTGAAAAVTVAVVAAAAAAAATTTTMTSFHQRYFAVPDRWRRPVRCPGAISMRDVSTLPSPSAGFMRNSPALFSMEHSMPDSSAVPKFANVDTYHPLEDPVRLVGASIKL